MSATIRADLEFRPWLGVSRASQELGEGFVGLW